MSTHIKQTTKSPVTLPCVLIGDPGFLSSPKYEHYCASCDKGFDDDGGHLVNSYICTDGEWFCLECIEGARGL